MTAAAAVFQTLGQITYFVLISEFQALYSTAFFLLTNSGRGTKDSLVPRNN